MPGRANRRYGRQKDANHDQIVAALHRSGGIQCVDLSAMGEDVPDILVGIDGAWFLVEIKTANGRETPGQAAFRAAARGPVFVIRSVDDFLTQFTKWRARRALRGCE